MKFNKITLDSTVTRKLQILKGKLGLTPNILCRYGLILSLKDRTIPDTSIYKQNGQELMRHVLLGELDTILIALFKYRVYKDGFDFKDEKLLIDIFRAHINRGAELLYNRVKDLKDMKELIDILERRF